MDLKRLTERAKNAIGKRGGTDRLKEDASQLKDIAAGQGSLGDKAKAAADQIKAPGPEESGGPAGTEEPGGPAGTERPGAQPAEAGEGPREDEGFQEGERPGRDG